MTDGELEVRGDRKENKQAAAGQESRRLKAVEERFQQGIKLK